MKFPIDNRKIICYYNQVAARNRSAHAEVLELADRQD